MKYTYPLIISLAFAFGACSDDENGSGNEPVNEPVRNLSDEYYAGGKLGTVFNESSFAYEQPTPVVEEEGFSAAFKRGESLFEKPFVTTDDPQSPRRGLGPLYLRPSCLHCHPQYGHGKRQTEYNSTTIGNGYLLVITDEKDNYLSSLTGMPQTRAVAPFKAPIDETKIKIDWKNYTDEWGNKFPDGETYQLIYPDATIPQDAYYVPFEVTDANKNTTEVPYGNVIVRLESTIGIYGTALLDAIPDDSLKLQYTREELHGAKLNTAFFKGGEWVKQYAGKTKEQHPYRFTYALSRGPLEDGPGANAIWNITNVTRSDRMYHYMTAAYAKVASKDPDVQESFYDNFPEYNKTGDVEKDIYSYLTDTLKTSVPEMTDDEYTDFMVWHRGLAVPAARDMDDMDVKKGKDLFAKMGCTNCHRPSWRTGDDKYTDPNGFFANGDARLPRYPDQKIWPYSDLVQHRLEMQNNIRTGWCRTTPLWGRGLSEKCTGASDRLHDCRARNVIEAILWHGASNSDARKQVEQFRELSKADRDAVVKFIEAI